LIDGSGQVVGGHLSLALVAAGIYLDVPGLPLPMLLGRLVGPVLVPDGLSCPTVAPGAKQDGSRCAVVPSARSIRPWPARLAAMKARSPAGMSWLLTVTLSLIDPAVSPTTSKPRVEQVRSIGTTVARTRNLLRVAFSAGTPRVISFSVIVYSPFPWMVMANAGAGPFDEP
jgi:hypothetical protein